MGRFWWQWGQPQHQHFVACEEMVAAVEDVGFDVVSVERGPATMGGDLYNSIGLWLQEVEFGSELGVVVGEPRRNGCGGNHTG